MRVWHTAQKSQTFGLIVRRHRFPCPFPHSFSISSFSVHFLILFPFPHSLSISSFSFHFLILFPFPHSLSISSFSIHFLILSPFPLNFLIFSPFPLHFLILSPFPLHFLILFPFPRSPAPRLQRVAQPWFSPIFQLHSAFCILYLISC